MYTLSLLSLLTAASALAVEKRQEGPIDPSTTPLCTYYTEWPVEYFDQGETCASIADFWGISEQQFITWNPVVGSDCSNRIEGNSYCIEANGRPSTSSSSSSVRSTTSSLSVSTSSSSRSSIIPSTSSRTSTTPSTTSKATTSSSSSRPTTSTTATGPAKPSPTQGGLTTDCQRFYLVESGDFYQAIVDKFGTFSLNQFYSWNPAVGSNCGGLQSGYYVCVGVSGTPTVAPTTSTTSSTTPTTSNDPSKPQPTQGGLTPDCQAYYLVQQGDFCQGIVDSYGTFSLSQLYSWNPAVGNNCGGLQSGYYVCVGVAGTPTTRPSSTTAAPTPTPNGPQPQQAGIIDTCQRYYFVQQGDICQSIVDQYGTFSLSQFYSWNPAIGNNCGGLQSGYYVCVGIAGTPTTRPPTTSATLTPTPTGPQPQQPGVVNGCQRYYFVQQGDFCQGIVDRYGSFSLQQFYSWNPAVGNNCGGLQSGYYVCVGVAGTPSSPTSATSTRPTGNPTPTPIQPGTPRNCSRYGQANSGGTCPAFAQRFGISLQNLYRWNPALGSNGENCQSSFWAGNYYCVAVS